MIHTIAFSNLTNLIILNLSMNALTSLPLLTPMMGLQVLDLSENNLENLTSETFYGLINLQSLLVSGNMDTKLSVTIILRLSTLSEMTCTK